MRMARIKIAADRSTGFYHCISRVINRDFIFTTSEKEEFVRILREYEAFCEVRILTYCLMSNHFHVLIEVPKAPDYPLSAETLLAKLRRLTCLQPYGWVGQQLRMYRQNQDAEGERRLIESFQVRMWDVSWFMRLVKQRFSMGYNRRSGRKGTLWEERFKSVVVDGAGRALATMAAYIDLNPVRARLVKDPKDYRWCGYGEAVAGRRRAKLGLRPIVRALLGGKEESPGKSLEIYRTHVYREGSMAGEVIREDGRPIRGAFSHETVLAVLEGKGRLSMTDYLRCRVRYFCDGAVFGSREFVDGIFEAHRDWFGKKRKNGARRMRGVEEHWYALRDLRMRLFG